MNGTNPIFLIALRSVLVAIAMFAAVCARGAPQGGTIDERAAEIVRRHVDARGGAEPLAAIRSLAFYGDDGPDAARPYMIKMKPHYSIAGCSAPDCGYAEGFDGTQAWETQPRRQRAYVARGEAAKAIRRAGAINFPFIEPRDDAAAVRFTGSVAIDGKIAERIDVHMVDGLDQAYYFDPATHLLVANDRTVPLHARPPHVKQRTYFSDWRPVAGVLYPFHLETRRLLDDGSIGDVIESGTVARIVANSIDDPAVFAAPAVHPAPLTQLVLDLYARAALLDAGAILQRYRVLRSAPAYVATDTESDLTWLGYELLKDETVDKALAVFDQLLHEYPQSSSAWDSLGDGREQAGDMAGAITAFRVAVALDAHAEDSAAKLTRLLDAGGRAQ